MFDNRWDNWSGDFAESVDVQQFATPVRDFVPVILAAFGDAVREIDPGFPDDVSTGTFATVFASTMTRLTLPDDIRLKVPDVVAAFLDYLQESGRIGEGADWAAQVRVMAASYRDRLKPGGGVKGVTIRKSEKTSPLGRNDPCPCGSGKKFKKCCGARS